jgi:hypothetical protein
MVACDSNPSSLEGWKSGGSQFEASSAKKLLRPPPPPKSTKDARHGGGTHTCHPSYAGGIGERL